MQKRVQELTGRVLVLVAHADDEAVAYGAMLQRMSDPLLAIVTDGAPRDPYFWQQYGSREAYRQLRASEARKAAECLGVRHLFLLAEEDECLEDQRLFLNLAAAWNRLCLLVEQTRPESIATLAYEGGHPDHDGCSLLAWRLGQRYGLPVWEAPIYARDGRGEVLAQSFLRATGGEVEVEISAAELARKRAQCALYVSQSDALKIFDLQREWLRPQAVYDYGRPPHEGQTNYEMWQWWMSAEQVCAKFREFMEAKV